MSEIKKIAISGFRGINRPPLVLAFEKENSLRSMMIYGRNGTGKSSIVDAWEWLYSGKIEHLAREGAGPQSYPHKEACEGETYVEVEFKDEEIGKIRMEYDPVRITQPKIEGDISKLREHINYPCHLRYRDLTEFVYKRKAEKYEILSKLMGFGDAINIQNDLQSCVGKLEQKHEILENRINDLITDYRNISQKDPKTKKDFLKFLNKLIERHGIKPIKEIKKVEKVLTKLRKKVEEDERSKRLALLKEIQRIINRFYPIGDLREKISEFQIELISFKEDEKEFTKLILLSLYEKGIEAIEKLEIYDICPLCDELYKGEGTLVEHIKEKQSHLEGLRERRDNLNAKKQNLYMSIDQIVRKIENASSALEETELEYPFSQFEWNLNKLIPQFEECREMFSRDLENIEKEFDFIKKIDVKPYDFLLNIKSEIQDKLKKDINILEKDRSRKQLVEDFQKAQYLYDIYLKYERESKIIERFEEIKIGFEKVKNDYIEETKRNVQSSFDSISSDVVKYFNILEKDNEVITDPKIKLISERDKAVVLEVMFSGELVSPVYKILSESQLNSFGLSIFLASVKKFNINFKFIILDDIINSFDAYKRPRVIDLLEEHFKDYQVLLLTHDSVWLDRLQRSFPKWIRKHFYGWDYTLGPRIEPGKNSYEQIEEFLSKDNPTEAGRTFGVYLEWILQLLCENMEASVKFNRKNEYTLFELLESFRKRMKRKLKENHSIVQLILDFEADTGFRNFCSHWKDPEIPYSPSEIKEIVEKWKNIESEIECSKCHKFIEYEKVNGFEHIYCPCRKLNLKSDKYYK